MVEFDVFRLELAAALWSSARRCRESHARHPSEARDLRGAESCERLAADAEDLDLHIFLLCKLMFTRAGLEQRFRDVRDGLIAEVCGGWRPATATEFVRGALRLTLDDAPREWRIRHVEGIRRPGRPIHGSDVSPSRGSMHRTRLAAVEAGNRSLAWIGIVAPVLSVWEFGRGASQWNVQSSSDLRPAVQAEVTSVEPVASLRHPPAAYDAVISFRPSAGSPACQASVRIGGAQGPEAGTTLMVLPRSAHCRTPLLPSEIGDPFATWALAAALMIGGASALSLQARLHAARTARRFCSRPLPRPDVVAARGVG